MTTRMRPCKDSKTPTFFQIVQYQHWLNWVGVITLVWPRFLGSTYFEALPLLPSDTSWQRSLGGLLVRETFLKTERKKEPKFKKRHHLCSGAGDEEKVGDSRRLVAADRMASSGSLKDTSSGKTPQLPQKGGGSSSSQSSSDQNGINSGWEQNAGRSSLQVGWENFVQLISFSVPSAAMNTEYVKVTSFYPDCMNLLGLKVSQQDLCTCYQSSCTKPHGKHETITTSCTVIGMEAQ